MTVFYFVFVLFSPLMGIRGLIFFIYKWRYRQLPLTIPPLSNTQPQHEKSA